MRLPHLGIHQRGWEPPRNLTLKDKKVWLQNFHRTGEIRNSWMAQNLVCTSTEGKGAVIPQETEPDLPWVFDGLLWRHGSAVTCHGDRGTSSCSSGRHVLAEVLLEVTIPTIEPVDSRTRLPQAKKVAGREHSPTYQQTVGVKIYWAWSYTQMTPLWQKAKKN